MSILQSPKILALIVTAVCVGGFKLLASWGPTAVSSADRAQLIRNYNLKGEEVAALDLCSKLMRGRKIKGDGDVATYCGCLAKHATDEMHEPYKTNAIRAAQEIFRTGSLTADEARYYLPNDSFTGLRKGAVMTINSAVKQCASESRDATFDRRKEDRERRADSRR